MSNYAPLLTIVIANYNYGRFLEEAIQSVIAQNMGDKVELIICDAASTDNSVEIIKKYANVLPPNTSYDEWRTQTISQLQTPNSQLVTWWCSEPDGGQSAAFNKGFSHAKGRFLTWLNADDVMLPATLKKLETAITKHQDCEWFVGGCLWLDPAMLIINCGRGRSFSEMRYREGVVSVWGPSSFFTKRLLNSVGGVDERFHFAMDTDLWLRFACRSNARYLPFCNYAWGLRLHPDAKMSGHNFALDGKFDDRRSEQEKLASSKHTVQMNKEAKMKLEYFTPVQQTRFSRFVSACWPKVIAAKFDLWRFKGRHYLEMFK